MLCRQCRRARLAGGTRGEHGLGVGERCKQPPPMQQPAPWRREPPPPSPQGPLSGPQPPSLGRHIPHGPQSLPLLPSLSPEWVPGGAAISGAGPQSTAAKGRHLVAVCLGWEPAPVQPADLGLTVPPTRGRRQATWKWQRAEARLKRQERGQEIRGWMQRWARGTQTVWERCPLALRLTARHQEGRAAQERDRPAGAGTGGPDSGPLSGGQGASDVAPAQSSVPWRDSLLPPPALLRGWGGWGAPAELPGSLQDQQPRPCSFSVVPSVSPPPRPPLRRAGAAV